MSEAARVDKYGERDTPIGEDSTPHYISLLKWTDQGIRNIKEAPKRADAAKALIRQLGGTMDLFVTLGAYDVVALSEAPNDEVVLQALLQLGSAGNVRSETMKAFTLDEATRVIAKLKQA